MLMIVLGAGATYDSIPSRPPGSSIHPGVERPPLANELFAARPSHEGLQRQLRHILQITPQLQPRNGASVEDLLAGLHAEANDYPERRRQLLAVRFYLAALIAQSENQWCLDAPVSTNHMVLLDRLERNLRGGALPPLVTFNYDRLLEQAIENRGQRIRSVPDYINGRHALFKLHGSVDWCRPVDRFEASRYGGTGWQVAQQIVDAEERLSYGAITKQVTVGVPTQDGQVVVPAIAIPLRDKTTFECPDEHIKELARRLPEVTALLMIGWRAGERHFLELLARECRQVLHVTCVCGSDEDGREAFEALRRAGIGFNGTTCATGFTEYLKGTDLERLCRL